MAKRWAVWTAVLLTVMILLGLAVGLGFGLPPSILMPTVAFAGVIVACLGLTGMMFALGGH